MIRALALALLLALPAAAQEIEAEDNAQVQTGDGIQIRTGDNSPVTINQFTRDDYAAQLLTRLNELTDRLLTATDQAATLRAEKGEVQRRLGDLEASYAQRVEELRQLRLQLSDVGEGIAAERVEAAQRALYEGDTTLADQIFAEVERMEQDSIDRAANAAYQRGLIAEEDIRWLDAPEHYETRCRPQPDHLSPQPKPAQIAWKLGALPLRRGIRTPRFAPSGERSRICKDKALWLGSLGVYIQLQGRLEEAEPLFRQAIEIDEATIGTAHPDYAIRLNNLASLLQAMGRLEEAEPLYRQAIENRRGHNRHGASRVCDPPQQPRGAAAGHGPV